MTRAALVAIRRLRGRCYYCGERVLPQSLTCVKCNQLPASDPYLAA